MGKASALAVVIGVTAGSLGGPAGFRLWPGTVAVGAEEPSPATSVQELLRKGIDEYRWGNYDEASRAFDQAAKQPNLTERDQELLNRYRPRLARVRQSRQEAADALQAAQQAFNAGDHAQAKSQAETAAGNQYVSPEVRDEAKSLLNQIQSAGTSAAPARSTGEDPRRRQAQQLLANARQQLREGNVDEAEALAHQADAHKLTFSRFEDSPAKLLRDVADARKGKRSTGGVSYAEETKQARALVAEAAAKLQQNELDQAESLAKQAKGLNATFSWFDKTPDDVLADVQKARRQRPSGAASGTRNQKPSAAKASAAGARTQQQPTEPEMIAPADTAATSDQAAAAQEAAAPEGDVNGSTSAAATLDSASDQTAAGQAEVEPRRAAVAPQTSPSTAARTAARPSAAPGTRAARDEAVELLRQGRAEMRAGNLDEAYRLAQLARDKKAKYGLLDDTPAQLAGDVARARARLNAAPPADSPDTAGAVPSPELAAIPMTRPPGKDKDVMRQAATLLKKARDSMARGDHDTAIEIAHRVNGWNLDYGVWDDTPGRVESAAQAMRSQAIARSARGQAQQEKSVAENLLADARRDLRQGRFDDAEIKARQAKEMRVTYSLLGDRPESVIEDINQARRRQAEAAFAAQRAAEQKAAAQQAAAASPKKAAPSAAIEAPVEPPPMVASNAADETNAATEPAVSDAQKKSHSRQLVWQARKMIEAGQLDDAEQLTTEAEAYQLTWSRFGDSPEKLRRDLSRVRTRSTGSEGGDDKAVAQSLLAEARRDLRAGRLDDAEHKAVQAQQLAVTYTLFADRPESVLSDIQRARRRAGQDGKRIAVEPSAVAQTPVAGAGETEMTDVTPPIERSRAADISTANTGADTRETEMTPATPDNSLPPIVVQELSTVRSDGLKPGGRRRVNIEPTNPAAEPAVQATTPRATVERQPSGANSNDTTMQSVEPASAHVKARPTEVEEFLSGARSDSPEVARAKEKALAQQLLAEARAALQKGQFDEAEQKVRDAQRLRVLYALLADRPEAVLADIQRARQRAGIPSDRIVSQPTAEITRPADVVSAAPIAPSMPEENPAALPPHVVKELSGAKSGKLTPRGSPPQPQQQPASTQPSATPRVAQVNAETTALGGTGEVVTGEVVTASPQLTPPVMEDSSSLTPDQKRTKARQLVAQARKLIDTGHLDEAEQCIVLAEAMQVKKWGILGDSPDGLRRDLARARSQNDKAVAMSLVAEARADLQNGRLDEAEHKARHAQQLPVTYGRWGDRPDMILADVSRAREGQAGRVAPQTGADTVAASGSIQTIGMNSTGQAPGSATAQGPSIQTGADMVRIVDPSAPASRSASTATRSASEPPMEAIDYLNGAESQPLTPQTAAARTGVKPQAGTRAADTAQQPVENTSLTTRTAPMRQVDPVEQKAAELMNQGKFADAEKVLIDAGRLTKPDAPVDPQEQRLELARKLFEAGNYPRAKETALEVQAASPGLRPQAEDLVARIGVMEQSTVYQLYEAGEAAARKGEYARALGFFKQVASSGVPLDPATDHQLRSYLRDLPARASHAQGAAQGGAVATVDRKVPASAPQQGDSGEGGIESAAKRQRIQFQQLVSETNQKVQTAKRLLTTDPGAAIRELEQTRDRVRASGLDESMTGPVARRVETAIQYAKQQKERFDADRLAREGDEASKAQHQRELIVEHEKQLHMQKLIEQGQTYMKEGRYADAEEVAKKATELEPDNPAAVALRFKSQIEHQVAIQKDIKEKKEQAYLESMSSVDRAGIPFGNDDNPLRFTDTKKWEDLTNIRRKQLRGMESGEKTEKDLEIERSLSRPVNVNFNETPLAEVVEFLREWTGVNIVLDQHALAADGISSDRPVSMKLDGVQLKNAMKLILGQMDLTYIVQNEALVITTPLKTQGKLYPQSYPVGDLVVSNNPLSQNALGVAGGRQPGGQRSTPGRGRLGLSAGSPLPSVGLGQFGSGLGGSSPLGAGPGSPLGGQTPALGGGPMPGQQVDFQSLIDLIQQTIATNSWSNVGGSGTVEFFQANLSLVVNQTQAVHEQIADLLTQLRRLADLQIAVEVRFISLSEDFFERVGIDFDMQIQSNQMKGRRHFGQVITPETGNTPAVLKNIYLDHEDDFAVGLQGQTSNGVRNFTPDMKIPFRLGNFGRGRPTNFIAGEGLNFGIAFLSDVEVSLFLEAAQQNNRGNVLQAPKLTMIQSPFPSTVFSGTIEPFVTELNPVVSGNSVAFEPTIEQFFNGAGMSVSAVVSADRRYVRLNLVPFFNQITRVEIFKIPAAAGGGGGIGGVGGSGIAIEAELRIPVIATNFVSTVVTVPDGGTILMGGLKTKTERRNEAGVPILSKIPYINRLFTDTGVQSQTNSLLLMVTPRIIILEEEEELLGKTLAF